MDKLTITGLVLGGATIIVDRYFCSIPDLLAIILYIAAVVLIMGGMLKGKKDKA